MTKVIANYLPQFHRIPENDRWWGEGYTDWTAVKQCQPLFEGHVQPKVPLDHHYYDLSQVEEIRRQAELAKRYGVYGFGIYHYWFRTGLQLLQTPAELLRDHPEIDIHYLFIWDNATWKRTWSNVRGANDWAPLFEQEGEEQARDSGVLAELCYGGKEDWKIHFEYLLPFFRDERYIKIGNKPVFGVFTQPLDPELLREMGQYWDELARKAGFAGMKMLGRMNSKNITAFDAQFTYEPPWDGWTWHTQVQRIWYKFSDMFLNKGKLTCFSYDEVWKKILKTARSYAGKDIFLSGFVNYDDAPRRGKNGIVFTGGTPEKFGTYFGELLKISNEQQKELVFLTAWNEWGEGAYLEPDEENRYAYLEALKSAVDSAAGQR